MYRGRKKQNKIDFIFIKVKIITPVSPKLLVSVDNIFTSKS